MCVSINQSSIGLNTSTVVEERPLEFSSHGLPLFFLSTVIRISKIVFSILLTINLSYSESEVVDGLFGITGLGTHFFDNFIVRLGVNTALSFVANLITGIALPKLLASAACSCVVYATVSFIIDPIIQVLYDCSFKAPDFYS
jgi:hypothetical protein